MLIPQQLRPWHGAAMASLAPLHALLACLRHCRCKSVYHSSWSPCDGPACVLRSEAAPAGRLDPSNPGFKLHRVEQLGTQWRETRHLDIGSLAQLPEQPAAQARAV